MPPRQGISMPIDYASEFDLAEAQDAHFVLANPVCIFDRLLDPVRERAADKIQAPVAIITRRLDIEVRGGFLHEVTLEVVEYLIHRSNIDSDVVPETFRLRPTLLLH